MNKLELINRIFLCLFNFIKWREARRFDKAGIIIKGFDEEYFYQKILPESNKRWQAILIKQTKKQ